MCISCNECGKCPLFDIEGTSCYKPCEYLDNADEIVDKWVQEHPVKTYADDFFEKFPDAQRTATGIPIMCIEAIYFKFSDRDSCPVGGCPECWNREMDDTHISKVIENM